MPQVHQVLQPGTEEVFLRFGGVSHPALWTMGCATRRA
jgi:hypothetical protein